MRRAGDNSQLPTPNSQVPMNSQLPNPNGSTPGSCPIWELGFGSSLGVGIWGFIFAVFLLTGCSKDEPPAPPPPPQKSIPPEPPLPPLGEVQFRDWSEVDEEKF